MFLPSKSVKYWQENSSNWNKARAPIDWPWELKGEQTMNLVVFTHAAKEVRNTAGQLETEAVKEGSRSINNVTKLELDFSRGTFRADYKNSAGVSSVENGEIKNLTVDGELPDNLFQQKMLNKDANKDPRAESNRNPSMGQTPVASGVGHLTDPTTTETSRIGKDSTLSPSNAKEGKPPTLDSDKNNPNKK